MASRAQIGSAESDSQQPHRGRLSLRKIPPAIQRYGLAAVSVALALLPSLLLQHHNFHNGELAFFLFAVALTAWYAGVGPAALSTVLSIFCFIYFFAPPVHSLAFTVADVPALVILVGFAVLITRFSAIRHRVEGQLLQSRDELEAEVAQRTQQASLLNLTYDAILVRDMNAVITYWNRGAEEMYGWTTQQAIGKRSHDLFQTIFPAPIADIEAELLRTGRWEGELRHTKPDGTRLVVLSRWSLRREEGARPAAILETNNDITDRKQREEEIERLNQELERRSAELVGVNKELEAFAYSVSHDLRSPLRHMAGYTELLQKNAVSTLDEKGKRYVSMVLDSAKRMGVLIDDLLAFSQIGRTETRKTMVSLEQLVKEVQSEVGQETGGRSITWRIGALPDVYGDRSMLRLVLVNLISNAVKFTRTRQQAVIEIGCPEKQKDRVVVVFIKDNGVGFDMKYVNKLFGVFQRLHSTEEFEGTGIGLATVQRIVHRHGGKVWAEGQVDSGATFYLLLPNR
jgi:PAS domain S-box-containing protein